MYYSPLRYPGGKRKLAPLMRKMIEKTGKKVYIEPFAGGASVALELIETGAVDRIVLNDSDIRIYAFWKEVLDETDRFIKTIGTVPLTIEEWKKQREICMNPDEHSLFDIGFSTFYLNRTNRSGILKGGVMGLQLLHEYAINSPNRRRNCKNIDILALIAEKIFHIKYVQERYGRTRLWKRANT